MRNYIFVRTYIFFVSYFGILIEYIRIRFICLYFVARYTANVSHIWSLKRSLTCFSPIKCYDKHLQRTTMWASLVTGFPMPLLAEHRYRPASSLVTAVKWSDRKFSPLTNPSVISTELPSCLHVITDAGLLDTRQLSDPDCVSVSCTSLVSILGISFKQSNLDNREQRIPKV